MGFVEEIAANVGSWAVSTAYNLSQIQIQTTLGMLFVAFIIILIITRR